MPPKKTVTAQKVTGDGGPVLSEGSDPVQTAVNIIDKKVRNLEKRKNKLTTLQESAEHGEQLKREQEEAIAKLGEVELQLELVKDLQKQFNSLNSEYEKSRKRQQKLAKQQARDSERDAQKRAVLYTLRVQDMLNCMGEADKENFRAGTNGALQLTDEDLSRLDELYKLLNPGRADNPSYKSELDAAGECMILMMEQSSKEVLETTYKQLNGLMESIDECGYFDQQHEEIEVQEEEEEEEDEDPEEDYKSTDDHVTTTLEHDPVDSIDYSEEPRLPVEEAIRVEPAAESQFIAMATEAGMTPADEANQPSVMGAPPSVITQTNMMSYMPSAPSPQFPGLAASPIQHTEEGFSFMHESEVDRTQGYQQPQATLTTPMTTSQVTQAPQTISPPPSQDYTQFAGESIQATEMNIQLMSENGQDNAVLTGHSGISGGEAQTDVATGQSNPATSSQIQGTAESSSSYNQESYQRQSRNASGSRGWQTNSSGQNRRPGGGGGGGGGSSGWAGQQKSGGAYRNGRGYQGGGRSGGYEGYQGGYQNNSRSFQGGYQGRGGGRPNYRTGTSSGGGQRR